MSWNAHTDHIFGQFPGQIKTLYLCGPDGSEWGHSGESLTNIQSSEVAVIRKTPESSIVLCGVKYFFLRNADGYYTYNKSGKGVATFNGETYSTIALAAEGFKAEQCVTCLEKLTNYMQTLGYK